MSSTFRILLVVFFLVAAGVGIWWMLQRNQERREELIAMSTRQNEAISVSVAHAERTAMRDSFRVNGTFEPWRQAMVVPTLSGQVTRLLVSPGSLVSTGQVLLEIDNEYTRNELEAAELNLEQGRKDVARMENLIGDGGVTQRQYEEAKVKVESAEVKLNSLRKRILDAQVKAPIPGYVTPVPRMPFPVANGFVGQGNPVFQLVDVSHVNLRVLLTAEQVSRVGKGQEIQVRCDLFPERSFTGKVTYTGMSSDMLSKRYPVDVEVPNAPGHLIRGGMNGSALFRMPAADTLLTIPRQALLNVEGGEEAFVLENGKAYRRPLTTGSAQGDRIAVLSGLAAGDQVVVSGQINLTDGASVTIIREE